ncbi:MAG: hypothetical protein V4549_03475 [Bacteroidota bacterium]
MSEENSQINLSEVHQKANEARVIAAEAVRVASDLAAKTDRASGQLSEVMSKLSEAVIKLGVITEFMQKDIGEIKLNLSHKYVSHETFDPALALVRNTVADHEKRVRWLEIHVWVGIGFLLALQLILKFIIK